MNTLVQQLRTRKTKKLRGQQPAADIILETSEGMERGCNRTLSSRWQPDKLTLRIPGHSTSRCPTPRRNPTTTYGSTTTRRKNIEDLGLEILTLLQQLWRNSDRKSNQIVFFSNCWRLTSGLVCCSFFLPLVSFFLPTICIKFNWNFSIGGIFIQSIDVI